MSTARAMSFLRSRSAEKIAHRNGHLLDHLVGTYALLREWGDGSELCMAGLCHAVYGTDGFAGALVDLGDRDQVRRMIGVDAERIVYFYASCDRAHLYPRAGYPSITFRDRFTGLVSVPDATLLRAFFELTLRTNWRSRVQTGRRGRSYAPRSNSSSRGVGHTSRTRRTGASLKRCAARTTRASDRRSERRARGVK